MHYGSAPTIFLLGMRLDDVRRRDLMRPISGYLGKSDAFDRAIGDFALAYADQNENDHATLVAAVKAGRIKALVEEES